MKIIDYKLCNSQNVYEGYLTPRMMCAGYLQGGRDSCQVRAGSCRGQQGPAQVWGGLVGVPETSVPMQVP